MKNLVQYIIESSNKFTPTEDWLKEHYVKFNEELFNNELPKLNDIRLSAKRLRDTSLGCQGYGKSFVISKDYMENGMYKMIVPKPGKHIGQSAIYRKGKWIYEPIIEEENVQFIKSCIDLKPYILINTIYVATEFNLEDTLIHEMIHLWVEKDGLAPKRAHGKEFTRKCNEIRKLAKDKYGIEYELKTLAQSNDEYEFDDQKKKETDHIVKQNLKRDVVGIYLEFSEEIKNDPNERHYDKRFLFCTKKRLPKILDDIKNTANKKYLRHIYVSEDSYEEMCNAYGVFRLINTYRFWDGDAYKKAAELMTKNAQDIINESLLESKKPYIKPETIMREIPANTNLSIIDLEEIMNIDIENDSSFKIASSNKNDKNMINPTGK